MAYSLVVLLSSLKHMSYAYALQETPFMVYLPLFNPELKFASIITPSYELQI